MGSFDPTLAEVRFGCGLSPLLPAPNSATSMLSILSDKDTAARDYPIPTFEEVRQSLVGEGVIGKSARAKSQSTRKAVNDKLRKRMRNEHAKWARASLLRRLDTRNGFRERLTSFWADHFTAVGKVNILRSMHPTYVEEAIRPHIAGRFADMLKAVIRHPMMLTYLDQVQSAGPNSAAAKRSARLGGLNENLARELMELHTLGVDGPYSQTDVTQLAELLTGMSYDTDNGFIFRQALAEPGAETLLGKSYGGKRADIKAVDAALEDLADHPETAKHISQKLAVHFISDTPSEALVSDLTHQFSETGGDLMALYQTLLEHPDSWSGSPGNVKQPIDFVTSSLRALGVGQARMKNFRPRELRSGIFLPMVLMGQAWEQPQGPDGWPEEDSEWITPQRLAARIQWAMTVPPLVQPDLPDPREFVKTALADRASQDVLFAARAAETRASGVGLILASAAFQRM